MPSPETTGRSRGGTAEVTERGLVDMAEGGKGRVAAVAGVADGGRVDAGVGVTHDGGGERIVWGSWD